MVVRQRSAGEAVDHWSADEFDPARRAQIEKLNDRVLRRIMDWSAIGENGIRPLDVRGRVRDIATGDADVVQRKPEH
jgi:hypothetical protein